jgi:hypothetical protein
MIINHIRKGPLEYIVIDDFYDKDEVEKIKEEVKELRQHTQSYKDTVTAVDVFNNPNKTGKGLFVDEYYNGERNRSPILTYNRKLFNPQLVETLITFNAYYNYIKYCTYDATLLNYYKDKEEYLPHIDDTLLTVVTTFKVGEFSGGEFCFPDYNEVVEFKENRMIIFSGCILHQAKPISANEDSYRVSIAQFLKFN